MPRPVTPFRPVDKAIVGEIEASPDYQNFRPSGSGNYLLIYTLAGSGRITDESGSSFATQPGDALLYEPSAYQDYQIADRDERWHLYYSHFMPSSDTIELLRWRQRISNGSVASLSTKARFEVETAFKAAITDQRSRLSIATELVYSHLRRILLWISESDTQGNRAAIDPRIEKALALLSKSPAAPLSIKMLAARCSLSVSRFSHLFKKETGHTPQRVWEAFRIEEAKTLLTFTSLSIAEISDRLGYSDPFYFSTRFRKAAGSSPRNYRAEKSKPVPH